MLQIKKLLFGLVASLALTAALLAAFSALILKLGALPGEIAGTIALAIGCVSVFAAAFSRRASRGRRGCCTAWFWLPFMFFCIWPFPSRCMPMRTSPRSVCARPRSCSAVHWAAFSALGRRAKSVSELVSRMQGDCPPLHLYAYPVFITTSCVYTLVYIKQNT